ncbi:hemolysin family protein [bacterium]|nr:hemolysin family protein [bacterium]
MESTPSWLSGAPGTILLAAGCWLGAMLLGGLMTAHYRLLGLYRNGLLEPDALGPVVKDFVQDDRRFQVTIGTLYLALTVLGSFAWSRVLAALWNGALDAAFYGLYTVTALLGWYLGGLVFKLLAAGTALGYARTVGALVYPFSWLLRPWSSLMLAVMNRLDDTLWVAEAHPHLSAGEIRSLITEEGENATLDEDEREMIQSIFTFHDTAVREIMIPRIDMVILDGDLDVAASLEEVISSGHSRIPVYQGSVDRVIGILYSKDLLKLVREGRFASEPKRLAELVRPAYFIPESKKIDEVLDEFREQRIHMAVVIDEYGGIAGLVTLEDVLEEIVGEIEDEFDPEEELVAWLDARSLRLDPKIDLDDLSEVLGIPLEGLDGWETSETLGGLIYEAAGNVPRPGDEVAVGDWTITVEDVADQRIVRVLLQAPEPLPGFALIERPDER